MSKTDRIALVWQNFFEQERAIVKAYLTVVSPLGVAIRRIYEVAESIAQKGDVSVVVNVGEGAK